MSETETALAPSELSEDDRKIYFNIPSKELGLRPVVTVRTFEKRSVWGKIGRTRIKGPRKIEISLGEAGVPTRVVEIPVDNCKEFEPIVHEGKKAVQFVSGLDTTRIKMSNMCQMLQGAEDPSPIDRMQDTIMRCRKSLDGK
ncbi:MAG: hypothetical protein GY804_13180 [Alphaproteobacteria bacterium]|nr:hypothetical protein [Alphaproteobacteria bacterium]